MVQRCKFSIELKNFPPDLSGEPFKLNGTAEEALQQINDKHYALPFETDGRRLFKIGVNFSAETRNIEKWIVE